MVRDHNAHILYAHWTPKSYTVSFNGNGVEYTGNSIMVTYDKDMFSNLIV